MKKKSKKKKPAIRLENPNLKKSHRKASETVTPFQKWLLNYMTSHQMTNREFAEMCEINPSLISHYLKGTREPSYPTLQKIKDALDLYVNILFEFGEDEK